MGESFHGLCRNCSGNQGIGGVNFDIYKKFSIFFEYKLTYADMDADLTSGGSVEVEPWTNHLIFGLSYSFR